jgi:hypothetical protein
VAEAPPASVAAPARAELTPDGVLALQRCAGNDSVARLLSGGGHEHRSGGLRRAPALRTGAIDRALARAAQARVARCPDCGGTCHDEDVASLAAAGPMGKALGGDVEFRADAEGSPPVIDAEAGAEQGEQGEQEQGAAAATEVDLEVIDESPDDGLDEEAPEPEADETPEAESAENGGGGTLMTKRAPQPAFDYDRLEALAKCGARPSSNMTSAAAASIPLGATDYGLTFPEAVDVKFRPCREGATWSPAVLKLTGRYSLQIRLLPGQSEVTGPRRNTTSANFCDQVTGLATLGNTSGNTWYMLRAVKKHEQVHKSRFVPALRAVKRAIVTSIESVSIPHVAGMTNTAASAAIKADPAFQAAVTGAQALWLAEILTRVAGDHASGGPAEKAEHRVVDPMIKAICKTAKAKKWTPACPDCP